MPLHERIIFATVAKEGMNLGGYSADFSWTLQGMSQLTSQIELEVVEASTEMNRHIESLNETSNVDETEPIELVIKSELKD